MKISFIINAARIGATITDDDIKWRVVKDAFNRVEDIETFINCNAGKVDHAHLVYGDKTTIQANFNELSNLLRSVYDEKPDNIDRYMKERFYFWKIRNNFRRMSDEYRS